MNKFSKLFELLGRDKKTLVTVAIGLVGILLVLLSLGGGSDTEISKDGLEEYKSRLEAELEALCESIDGAGRCRVTVSFSEGERLEYKGSSLIGSEPPRVLGITVVCDGGDDSYIKNSISDCMTALFDIGSNRVCVLKLK